MENALNYIGFAMVVMVPFHWVWSAFLLWTFKKRHSEIFDRIGRPSIIAWENHDVEGPMPLLTTEIRACRYLYSREWVALGDVIINRVCSVWLITHSVILVGLILFSIFILPT